MAADRRDDTVRYLVLHSDLREQHVQEFLPLAAPENMVSTENKYLMIAVAGVLGMIILLFSIRISPAITPSDQIIIFNGSSSASGSGGVSCSNGNLFLQYNDACQLMSQMVGN